MGPHVSSTEEIIRDLLAQDKNILLEGAQGTLLDVDHGSYPYVTSSSPSIGGACTGLGLDPRAIAGVLGVFKAYSTRVGEGPMPSEIFGQAADDLREKAQEFGTTTGRPRRIGWFDAVAGRYSRELNGLTGMVITRLDILDGFPSVKVCVGYRANGRDVDGFPANTNLLAQCQPVYEELPGWDRPHGLRHRPVPTARERHSLREANRRTCRVPGPDYLHRPAPRRDHRRRPVHSLLAEGRQKRQRRSAPRRGPARLFRNAGAPLRPARPIWRP